MTTVVNMARVFKESARSLGSIKKAGGTIGETIPKEQKSLNNQGGLMAKANILTRRGKPVVDPLQVRW
jgi:hypothetical protein